MTILGINTKYSALMNGIRHFMMRVVNKEI